MHMESAADARLNETFVSFLQHFFLADLKCLYIMFWENTVVNSFILVKDAYYTCVILCK